jgi:uracil DNA glycosylase
MNAVVTGLSTNFEGLFFCFWGSAAKIFSYRVNPDKHKKLFAYHPAYACRNNTDWECDHFKLIHNHLKIKW